jgi:hypothetical protein
MMLRVKTFRSAGAWCKSVAAGIGRRVVGLIACGHASLATDAQAGVVEQSQRSAGDGMSSSACSEGAAVVVLMATAAGTPALAMSKSVLAE